MGQPLPIKQFCKVIHHGNIVTTTIAKRINLGLIDPIIMRQHCSKIRRPFHWVSLTSLKIKHFE